MKVRVVIDVENLCFPITVRLHVLCHAEPEFCVLFLVHQVFDLDASEDLLIAFHIRNLPFRFLCCAGEAVYPLLMICLKYNG